MNSANQRRVQMKQADNKMVSDLVSAVNQRMMMANVLDAQKQAGSGPATADAGDLAKLLDLLKQVAPNAAPAGENAQPASVAKSLSVPQDPSILSRSAVLAFDGLKPIAWSGHDRVVFSKNGAIVLKVKLAVADPAPSKPIPKAIFKFTFKLPSNQDVVVEKSFKQKNVLPNNAIEFSFSRDELSKIPINTPVTVFAEIRWQAAGGTREYKALGSTDILFANQYLLKEQGGPVSEEKELTDMQRYRTFWNKVWESPVPDASRRRNGDGNTKKLWALDATMKYEVHLTPEHDTNGLMPTRLVRSEGDREELTDRTEGKMKAGIELSVGELAKLRSLWDNQPPLSSEQLEAFNSAAFALDNQRECVRSLQLKGKARERAMVWVIPVFKLFDCTLAKVQGTDEMGQVTVIGDEKITFPLAVAARVIGLKSEETA
jgi:hypothetical protein